MNQPLDKRVSAIAALDEPTRRRLYDHVVHQSTPVTRDEAAEAVDVARATAAFHLDRLAAEGLLDVVFERRTGRSGPGAGRPAKLYCRAKNEVAVSLPERHYDLAGSLLAGAIEDAAATGESPAAALDQRARAVGRDLAEQRLDGEPLAEVLENCGYEPRPDGAGVVMANCPFHVLAREHTQLVCGMNLSLLGGLLEGLGATGLRTRLDPAPGRCCVVLEPRA